MNLRKIDSSFAEANYNYWMVRFCPDLLSSDRQIQYQQIYRLFTLLWQFAKTSQS